MIPAQCFLLVRGGQATFCWKSQVANPQFPWTCQSPQISTNSAQLFLKTVRKAVFLHDIMYNKPINVHTVVFNRPILAIFSDF